LLDRQNAYFYKCGKQVSEKLEIKQVILAHKPWRIYTVKTYECVTAAAANDVVKMNTTITGVTVTSDDTDASLQSQNLDSYSVWTARMNEANMFLCLR